jgi:aspartate aminotransferase
MVEINNDLIVKSSSVWGNLTPAPADPILGLNDAFKKDQNPNKVLLGMGAYRDDNCKPYVLPCVRIAEERIMEKQMDHEYAGITGIDGFVDKSIKLAYGGDNAAYLEKRIAAAQSLSGTGALRLGLTFFKEWYPYKDVDVMLPKETWPLHRNLIDVVGLPSHKPYRWFHPVTKDLDFDGLTEDLENCKDHSMVLFHVCAHNPTGVDPTKE